MSQRIVPLAPAPGGRPPLICFGHAGSGVAAFRAWSDRPEFDVRVVRLPGREKRLAEPPITALSVAVAHVADELAVAVPAGDPIVLFGQCSGAVLALEVARELERRGGVRPGVVGLAGFDVAAAGDDDPDPADLPREKLVEQLRAAGTMDEMLLDRPALLDMVLPVVRADLRLTWRYRPATEPRLDAGLVVVNDLDAPAPDPDAWRHLTRGRYRVVAMTAGRMPGAIDAAPLFPALRDLLDTAPAGPSKELR